MTDISKGLIHVAGIIDAAEAELLIGCGACYLGFPLVLDQHEEDLSVAEAASIVSRFGSRATFFLITYLREAGAVLELRARLGVSMVQLHGDISVVEAECLRHADGDLRVIKSLIVRRDNLDSLVDEANRFAPLVDALITDTFDPETGATGATGKTHDWTVSAEIVRRAPRPVILAGGLAADNVRDAIAAVRPAGVDVHTGIEGADGRKRRDLAKRFVAEARAGFAEHN